MRVTTDKDFDRISAENRRDRTTVCLFERNGRQDQASASRRRNRLRWPGRQATML